MSLKIIKWLRREESFGKAIVDLNGVLMDVLIKTNDTSLLPLDTQLIIEFDFDELIDCKRLTGKTDSDSVILKKCDYYEIIGKVINIVPVNTGSAIIDLYLQNGPEFIAFTSATEKFEINDFVWLQVKGLCCFP